MSKDILWVSGMSWSIQDSPRFDETLILCCNPDNQNCFGAIKGGWFNAVKLFPSGLCYRFLGKPFIIEELTSTLFLMFWFVITWYLGPRRPCSWCETPQNTLDFADWVYTFPAAEYFPFLWINFWSFIYIRFIYSLFNY